MAERKLGDTWYPLGTAHILVREQTYRYKSWQWVSMWGRSPCEMRRHSPARSHTQLQQVRRRCGEACTDRQHLTHT